MTLDRGAVEPILHRAFAEDAPWGDVTSEALVPVTATVTAELVAREDGVFSGGDVFAWAMQIADPGATTVVRVADGARFTAGCSLARVSGNARAVLRAERVALNLVQRMSGIATLTARYVEAVSGTSARIVDTRKTTPGLRILERHAVRCGGAANHRFSLSDAVLAKDNHLAVLAQRGEDLTEALRRAKASLSHTTHFEVEVDRLDQIEPVLAAGVDTIMLDNFSPDDLAEGVRRVGGRALTEASGGVNLDTAAAIAATGVDLISVGALTHSVRSLDLGLDISVSGSAPVSAPGSS